MRIPGDIPKITGTYDKIKSSGRVGSTSAVSPKMDVVSISSTAKDYQTVQKALKDVPDIRQSRVNELSGSYESGSYNVDGSDIADSILKNTFDLKA
ncbi:MAG: flagellar biosynthesis anti-sigma factor FlgM [Clostridiales bacterium]|nr:flagellar biosynthesis anti-sigma factor FlgM [Clostridiales bacterium]